MQKVIKSLKKAKQVGKDMRNAVEEGLYLNGDLKDIRNAIKSNIDDGCSFMTDDGTKLGRIVVAMTYLVEGLCNKVRGLETKLETATVNNEQSATSAFITAAS